MPALLTPTLNALTEVLSRHWLERGRPGDAELARQLTRSLVVHECPPELLAVATGGTWAAFRPDGELDAETIGEIIVVARILLGPDLPDNVQALAGVALAVMARRGMSSTPGSDLIRAAVSAQRIEHHEVALLAARAALSGVDALQIRDAAIAWTLIARMTTNPVDVEAALASVSTLDPDDPIAKDARAIRRVGGTAQAGRLRSAGDALAAGDRQGAATAILADVALFAGSDADQAYIESFRAALTTLTRPVVDVPELRTGLIGLVRQLRRRQRFGMLAPAALAGIDMMMHLLLADDGDVEVGGESVRANVVVELMEALADAGLSEADPRESQSVLAAVAQARLADESRNGVIWPDMAAALAGLHGARAVLFYTYTSLAGRVSVLAAYIEPPGGVAFRRLALSEENGALLRRFATAAPEDLRQLSGEELDALVAAVLPTVLRERLRDEPGRDLVLVPVGPLWAVPWEGASELRQTRVVRAPSLSVLADLAPVGAVRHVVAVVDQTAPGAAEVYDALYEARAAEKLNVSFSTRPDSGADADLLLVYAHGRGEGLTFRTGEGAGFTAHELAQHGGARAVVIAACWSAGPPPLAFPASLPSTMLRAGSSVVAGGIWPLPALPTAQLLVDVITRLADGQTVVDAITEARRGNASGVFDSWGLAVHGRVR